MNVGPLDTFTATQLFRILFALQQNARYTTPQVFGSPIVRAVLVTFVHTRSQTYEEQGMKTSMFLALTLMIGGAGLSEAQASVIVVNFPEVNGPAISSGFPAPPLSVGTQTYAVPAGETVTSASLSGIFGQTSQYTGSTAEFDLFLNGILVGSTFDVTPDPFFNVVPFNFLFTNPAVLSSLGSGSATLSLVQQSNVIIRLSSTQLTLNTTSASPTPEPAAALTLGAALVGLVGYRWRRRPVLAA